MNDLYLLACVIAAYVIALLAGAKHRPLLPWLLAGVTFRVVILLLDIMDVWQTPTSGADAAGFIRQAHVLSAQSWGAILAALDYGSASSYQVSGAILFKVFGFNPYIMQATNLVVGTVNMCLAVLLVRKHVGPVASTGAAVLLCLYPFTAINSVVALREEFSILFFLLGLTFLFRWISRASIVGFIAANFWFVVAASVHPGFIAAVIASAGYFIFVAMRDLRTRANKQSAAVSLVFGVLLFSGAMALLASGVEIGKGIELSLDPDALSETVEGKFQRDSRGGSAYPAFVAQGDPFSQPWLIPARMLYLLYSPFPWDIRSAVHVTGFLVGALYIWLSIRAWRAWRRGAFRGRAQVLVWMFLLLTLVFAVGTTNSGTAVRHKTKFFPLLVLLAAPTFRRRVVLGREIDRVVTIPTHNPRKVPDL